MIADIDSQAPFDRNDTPADDLPMWRECFLALEAAMLHVAPIYWGFGAPHGDGSAVVLIPGFLGTDTLMAELYAWLYRMDYRPYFSGIGINAECPNLLIKGNLNATIDRARRETKRKVHLVGHSLGGMIAISLAAQRPDDIASVISLAAPFRGKAAHPNILRLAEYVRGTIQCASRRQRPAGLLYRSLPVQLRGFARPRPVPHCAPFCRLHANRRHRGLAILHHRRFRTGFRGPRHAHRIDLQPVGLHPDREAAVCSRHAPVTLPVAISACPGP